MKMNWPKFGKKNRQGNAPVVHTLPEELEPYRGYISIQVTLENGEFFGFPTVEAALNCGEKLYTESPYAKVIRDRAVSTIQLLAVLHERGLLATSDLVKINEARLTAGLEPLYYLNPQNPYPPLSLVGGKEAAVTEKEAETILESDDDSKSLEELREEYHAKRREEEGGE